MCDIFISDRSRTSYIVSGRVADSDLARFHYEGHLATTCATHFRFNRNEGNR